MTIDTHAVHDRKQWWWKFHFRNAVCSPTLVLCYPSPLASPGVCSLPFFCGFGVLLRQGLVGPLAALPEAALTYLFETKLAVASFHGSGYRPEVAALFGLLFVHVNCRTKVRPWKRRKKHQVGVLFLFKILVPACCGRLQGKKESVGTLAAAMLYAKHVQAPLRSSSWFVVVG